ncbi:MAG: cupin domain-containing protein [Methanomassiliicoccales archaeon]
MGFKAIDYKEVPLEEANEEGAVGAKIRWLISEKDGAENFSMRYFEIDEEGRSPVHNHPWEHEVFILKGRCRVVCDQEVAELGPGGVILVPENTDHNFQNVGEGALEFICVIPNVD